MATTSSHLTVAEFERLPDPPEGRYELHHGELHHVPPPTNEHGEIAHRLLFKLMMLAGERFKVRHEFAFRPRPEYEVWVADLALIRPDHARQIGVGPWLHGAPAIVIEVLSPSNTVREMADKQRTCFEGGCEEFWEVEPSTRSIRITRRDLTTRTCSETEIFVQ